MVLPHRAYMAIGTYSEILHNFQYDRHWGADRPSHDRGCNGSGSVLRQAFVEYEPLYTKQGDAATTPERATRVTRCEEGPMWVA